MTQRLKAFFSSNRDLRQLTQRVGEIAALQHQYLLIAPASLSQSSRIIQRKGQMLIIAADNGAVAAKLRQMSDELISSFITRGCEVTGIQIKVQVRILPSARKPLPRSIGEQGKKELETLAQSLENSPLKSALERLARQRLKP